MLTESTDTITELCSHGVDPLRCFADLSARLHIRLCDLTFICHVDDDRGHNFFDLFLDYRVLLSKQRTRVYFVLEFGAYVR